MYACQYQNNEAYYDHVEENFACEANFRTRTAVRSILLSYFILSLHVYYYIFLYLTRYILHSINPLLQILNSGKLEKYTQVYVNI